jgi:hypothetical protein
MVYIRHERDIRTYQFWKSRLEEFFKYETKQGSSYRERRHYHTQFHNLIITDDVIGILYMNEWGRVSRICLSVYLYTCLMSETVQKYSTKFCADLF